MGLPPNQKCRISRVASLGPRTHLLKKPADAPAEQPSGIIESTYDVEVKLSDLQADANSPLSLGRLVRGARPLKEINDGLLALNFKKPSRSGKGPASHAQQSASQYDCAVAVGHGKDSRVCPHRPITRRPQPIHSASGLILAPSRELARQIQSVVQNIGQFCTNLNVAAAIPGAVDRETGVKANVVVGTPELSWIPFRRRQFDVSQLKVLVIDEADNILTSRDSASSVFRSRSMLAIEPPRCHPIASSRDADNA